MLPPGVAALCHVWLGVKGKKQMNTSHHHLHPACAAKLLQTRSHKLTQKCYYNGVISTLMNNIICEQLCVGEGQKK